MIPNGGVAVTPSLPDDLVAELTQLLDDYADSSEEAASVMFDLVGLSDWTSQPPKRISTATARSSASSNRRTTPDSPSLIHHR